MSLAVRDECDEIQVFAFRPAQLPVDRIDQYFYEVNVFPLIEPAYIIGVGYLSFVEDGVNRSRMVFHEEPVTDIFSPAIDRERLSVPYIVDKQWNQLLRKLVWPVIVRTVGNQCRHAVGVVE